MPVFFIGLLLLMTFFSFGFSIILFLLKLFIGLFVINQIKDYFNYSRMKKYSSKKNQDKIIDVEFEEKD